MGLMDEARQRAATSQHAPAPKPPVLPWKAARQPGGPPARITAADLMLEEFPPPRFLVDGLLTAGLTVLAGKPKHGKSWLSLILGYGVATGEPIDGRAVHQGDVLYLALEDGRARLPCRTAYASRAAPVRGAHVAAVPIPADAWPPARAEPQDTSPYRHAFALRPLRSHIVSVACAAIQVGVDGGAT